MGCWRLKIYIVRHGETNGNLRGALQGWMDELLNEKGREVKDGKSVLVGDDVIYYNPSLCVNPYKPV